ncbi:pro-interleukin-16 isoform X2 [Poeciliopsis prolifica]|uniref:pro-interleukin-16 isoform X2 n=1 Tax=Poeciliopsis prolifica TaxID=188132 RepID=UPI002413FF91|nr:pro-interleukin-16 isoform X2 [Poeciliopsis prolifica]
MKEEENIVELREPSSIETFGNTALKASGSKIAPPVAPKPAWFNQSLRKIQENPDQRKQASDSKEIPEAGVTRRFGGRSTSGTVSMSFKQKILSFETFSAAGAQEKTAIRRSTPHPNLLALLKQESESACHSSDRDDGKSKQGIPTEMLSDQSTFVVNENVSVPPSVITSALDQDYCQPSGKMSEDQLSCFEIGINNPNPSDTICFETNSAIDDATSASVHSGCKFQPSTKECESEKVDISRSSVLPSAFSVRMNQKEGEKNVDEYSGNECEAPLRTAQNTFHTTECPPQKNQEGEHIGKIVAFSNQVSQAILRSLPSSDYGNLQSQNFQETPFQDVDNPQEFELGKDCKNKGFSVRLASLTESTIEQGRQTSDRETFAHSVISVIRSQGIQKMIEEVEAMDEETLKDVHVVILHKDVGSGLGFSIAGGCDLGNKAPTVHKVFPCGLAAQEGTIQKGDVVLSINGLTLCGIKHMDATAILRQTRNQTLAVVVICKGTKEEEKNGNRTGEEMEQETPLSVDVEKGPGGIGFSLEGGRGSIQGDRPLVINRIFKGGAGEQSSLQCGDEVLQVQGVSLQDMTRFEAWKMIKALPEGPVTLVIRRRQVAED